MGILDGIVEWIAEQIMYGLDMINTSVLGALGCDMNTFLRYFPAAETMYMVAAGDLHSTGSITGEFASQALSSYMGITAQGDAAPQISYSNIEIGGGRITGTEYSPEHPDGISFGMYHTGQYAAPDGEHQKVFSADGVQWYKQYAVDTVIKKPFTAPDGEIDYHKEIVKKMPDPPKRKDRM